MTPIGDCCSVADCGFSPLAVTGWCLASTGAPVLVVTTIVCDPVTGNTFTVTLVDPETGDPLPPQQIVACGDKDWQINPLCDYDPVTGALIATFTQIFEWDEDTGTLIITNVRSDDPTVVYVPTGDVRVCSTPGGSDWEVNPVCDYDPDGVLIESFLQILRFDQDTQVLTVTSVRADDPSVPYVPTGEVRVCDTPRVDVEIIRFCYDVGTDLPVEGIRQMVFVDGVYDHSHYFDEDGVEIFAPIIVPCIEQQSIVDIVGAPFATVGRLTNVDNVTPQCIPANVDRRHLIINIEGGGTMLMKFGLAPTAVSYTVIIPANGIYELPHPQIYTGIVCFLKVAGGTNNVQYTEVRI